MARTPALLLVALLTSAPLLAGCMSDEPTPEGEPAAPLNDEEPAVDTAGPMEETGTGGADDPGSRAHKHDYWGGATEINLVDADFETLDLCTYNYDSPVIRPRNGCFIVEMGNGSVVYQGTARLTVTATWDAGVTTGVAFDYRDAEKDHRGEIVELTSGTPHEIPVTPVTADIPHSKMSRWAFRFLAGGTGQALVMRGPIHVTITIHRGLDLPLDPPHPDFWGNKTELDLGTITGTLEPAEGQSILSYSERPAITLPEGQIVPPGTTSITVHFTWTVKDPAAGVDYHFWPAFRSAQHPYFEPIEEEDGNDADGTGSFTLPVNPEMTDSPYATLSQWQFSFYQYHTVTPAGVPLPTSFFSGGGPLDKAIDYTWHTTLTGGNAA